MFTLTEVEDLCQRHCDMCIKMYGFALRAASRTLTVFDVRTMYRSFESCTVWGARGI
jgi:hypothetical protein